MRCSRCKRPLKNEPKEINGRKYGPVCARIVKKDRLSRMYPTLKEFW